MVICFEDDMFKGAKRSNLSDEEYERNSAADRGLMPDTAILPIKNRPENES